MVVSDVVVSGMTSPYETWPGLQSHPLGREALKIRQAYSKPCRLSPLIALSDPVRTPDIINWAKALPEHCAVIYRFEAFDAQLAKALRKITSAKHQQFLIRSESHADLSDGQHFRRSADLGRITKKRSDDPGALLTLAAIKEGRYSEPLPALDGLLVSAIFPSESPSAGTPIGTDALRQRTQKWDVPIFALGGVTVQTVSALIGTNIAGIAAIGALKEDKNGR